MPSEIVRRILHHALLAMSVYVALLVPVGALAQDPTPTPTATGTPTATATSTPTVVPPRAASTSPTATATPAQTPAPAPVASPQATPTAQPSPTPTATPDTPSADAKEKEPVAVDDHEQKTDARRRCDRRPQVDDNSPSTRDRACPEKKEAKKKRAPARRDRDRKRGDKDRQVRDRPAPTVAPDGTPTTSNPSLSLAAPGAAPIGVPNFFIDRFRIPPFLLPIYQAAGTEYGIRWEVLAAINEIETDYGRNLNVSSAGALGWMQFMPATWHMYGVDANKDGVKDPFNPVDAIFAAARYLKAAGADQDIRRGIFAYNHADWYVDSVLLRARLIGGLPANFVGSLTGLTQARFPVDAAARYAGAVDTSKRRRAAPGQNAAMPVESDASREDIDIFAKTGSPVIAVNDGKISGFGNDAQRGRWISLRDVYGNTYTYSHLGKVATTYPAPRPKSVSDSEVARELKLPKADPKPTAPASSTSEKAKQRPATPKRPVRRSPAPAARRPARKPAAPAAKRPARKPAAPAAKDRLFAHPARGRAARSGGDLQLALADYTPEPGAALKLNKRDYVAKRMRRGAHVIGGTILGRTGRASETVAPHVRFAIRPAGKGAPQIDPKPILDGWKLLESTALYRALGKNPFVGPDADQPSIGQILLMSKDALQEHVLANPSIQIYECGRDDVRLGLVDRRVLATLEFLAASGLKPSVSSLRCGHGYLTSSGNVSEHSSGNALDIAAVNGIPILGHQGPGSITEMTIQRLLTLQGTMKPHQIISLMTFDGTDNTFSMADHANHIHLGFRPLYGTGSAAEKQADAVLKPDQWIKLIDRLGTIDNPVVATAPSKYALRVAGRGGD